MVEEYSTGLKMITCFAGDYGGFQSDGRGK